MRRRTTRMTPNDFWPGKTNQGATTPPNRMIAVKESNLQPTDQETDGGRDPGQAWPTQTKCFPRVSPVLFLGPGGQARRGFSDNSRTPTPFQSSPFLAHPRPEKRPSPERGIGRLPS